MHGLDLSALDDQSLPKDRNQARAGEGVMAIHTYTKLFSSITESTVWCEPMPTRIVWITMLAMSDRHGCMFATVPGLANRARVSLRSAKWRSQTFLSPDPYSRTPDHEGRRIMPIDGGWQLLNHAKYRDMRDEAVRREQNREAQERHRNKASAESLTVSQDQPGSAYTDTDTDTKKEKDAVLTGVSTECSPPSGKHIPPAPFDKIIDEYHRALPQCPRYLVRNSQRDRVMQGRWRQMFVDFRATDRAEAIELFAEYFAYCAKSRFLMGRTPRRDRNQMPFQLDLDWLMCPEHFATILEGKYHDAGKPPAWVSPHD